MPKRMLVRRQARAWSPYSRLGARAAGYAVRTAAKYAYRRWSGSGSRSGVTSGSGITAQYDRKTQYVRRRMPYKRRRRWVKFSRRVSAVMQKDIATRTVVFNGAVDTSGDIVSNATDQGVAEVMLYGFRGDADAFYVQGAQDLSRVLTALQLSGNSKIRFKSGVLDLTARSINQNIELDVYEVMCRRTQNFGTLKAALAQGFSDTPVPPGASTGLSLLRRGVTIFDCPKGIKISGARVMKKTKYFLPVGNTMTYQIRDPKNRYFNTDSLIGANGDVGFNRPGMTRVVFFVWKAVPGSTATPPAQLTIGATRKYAYTILEGNLEEDKYN